MSSIQNVAVIGKGLLGGAVIEQLVNANFSVTVLSRNPNSLKGLPAGVKTAKANYSSVDELVEALRGQDAVVSTVGMEGISGQKVVIDASIQAGVKRYIPSDWGANSTDSSVESQTLYQSVQEIQRYLQEKASSGQIEHTIFAIGPIMEYVISTHFFVDVKQHTVDLFDNGTSPFSSTSAPSIGKAVAGALKNAPATRNRVIRVHDIVLTQAKVLALAKKYTPGVEWHENPVDASERIEEIMGSIDESKGDLSQCDLEKWLGLLKSMLLSKTFCTEYDSPDNDLVGLPLMSEEDLEEIYLAGFQKSIFDHSNLDGKQH